MWGELNFNDQVNTMIKLQIDMIKVSKELNLKGSVNLSDLLKLLKIDIRRKEWQQK